MEDYPCRRRGTEGPALPEMVRVVSVRPYKGAMNVAHPLRLLFQSGVNIRFGCGFSKELAEEGHLKLQRLRLFVLRVAVDECPDLR